MKQTSKMELFAKIVNSSKPFNHVGKKLPLRCLLHSKSASVYLHTVIELNVLTGIFQKFLEAYQSLMKHLSKIEFLCEDTDASELKYKCRHRGLLWCL